MIWNLEQGICGACFVWKWISHFLWPQISADVRKFSYFIRQLFSSNPIWKKFCDPILRLHQPVIFVKIKFAVVFDQNIKIQKKSQTYPWANALLQWLHSLEICQKFPLVTVAYVYKMESIFSRPIPFYCRV